MKKTLKVVTVLIIAQMVVMFVSVWATVALSANCEFVPESLGKWQCRGQTDPIQVAFIASLLLPPLVARFALARFGISFSWRRVILTHLAIIGFVWIVLLVFDSPVCGCGGA